MYFFPQVELSFRLLLRKFLRGSKERATLIESSIRPVESHNLIKLILKERRRKKMLVEFESISAHYKEINDLRDKLVHRVTDLQESGIRVHNAYTARSLSGIEVLRLNIDDIAHAADDLVAMQLRLSKLVSPKNPNLKAPELKAVLKRAWLYRPKQPYRPHQESVGKK